MRRGIWLALFLPGALAAVGSACLADLPAIGPQLMDAGLPVISQCGDGVIGTRPSGGNEECDPGDHAAPGCTGSCTLACEGAVDGETGHCYFALGDDNDERRAQQACMAQGAHLVTLGDARELATVRAAPSITESDSFWVGLKYFQGGARAAFQAVTRDEPGFPSPPTTSQCSGCFAERDGGGYVLPSDGDAGDAFCVFTGKRGSFIRGSCTETSHKVVCEREPPGQRAHPCIGGVCVDLLPARGGTGKHFLFVPTEATATDARRTCEGYGGRLAVFVSSNEREAVVKELARRSLTAVRQELTFWIGMERSPDAGWQWIGSASTLDTWGNNAPEPPGSGGSDNASTTGAAYARTSLDPDDYDQELAHADYASSLRPFVCELID